VIGKESLDALKRDFEGELSAPPVVEDLLHDVEAKTIELSPAELQRLARELRTARARFEDAERRCADLFDHSPLGYILTERRGNVVEANRTATTILRMSRDELSKRRFSSLVCAQDLELFQARETELFSGGQSASFEVRLLRGDQSYLWARIEALVISASGLSRLRIVLDDITSRKQAELTLKENNSFIESLYYGSDLPFAIADIDANGDFVMTGLNPAHARVAEGIQIVGKTLREYQQLLALPDAEYERILGYFRACVKSGQPIQYEVSATVQGHTLWFLTHLTPIKNAAGEYYRVLTTSINIREQKMAEQALRASESRFQVFMNHLPSAAFIKDDAGRFLFANKYLQDLLGLVDWEGKTLRELGAQSTGLLLDDDGLSRRGTLTKVEEDIVDQFGTKRHFETAVFPIQLEGEPPMVGGIAVDITERRLTEEALQNTQRLDSLGVLAGGIAHDYNNLLQGIYGFIELAVASGSIEENHADLAVAITTIDRARDLTRQLLTFAKGGAPMTNLEPLFAFVRETAAFALSGSEVTCQVDVPSSLWACHYDRNQIGQVIDNLVINAKQAMPEGGSIQITAQNVKLAEGQEVGLVAGRYVHVTIADSGTGIPKEVLPRIFDPFFTTKTTGHGLGLATSYSIVRRHAGSIRCESEPDHGTTFHLFLPAGTTDSAPASPLRSIEHCGTGTLIVMDDEEVVRQTLSEILGTFGYRVLLAVNAQEALHHLQVERRAGREIRAMLLDLTIPGGRGGREAIAEIRKLDAQLPVFVASGYGDDPAVADPRSFGFTASLCKPFLKADLARFLEHHLGRNWDPQS
jgi:PAS domain S-box-containing protein